METRTLLSKVDTAAALYEHSGGSLHSPSARSLKRCVFSHKLNTFLPCTFNYEYKCSRFKLSFIQFIIN